MERANEMSSFAKEKKKKFPVIRESNQKRENPHSLTRVREIERTCYFFFFFCRWIGWLFFFVWCIRYPISYCMSNPTCPSWKRPFIGVYGTSINLWFTVFQFKIEFNPWDTVKVTAGLEGPILKKYITFYCWLGQWSLIIPAVRWFSASPDSEGHSH